MAQVTKFANAHTAIDTGYTNPTNAYADDGTNYATAAPAAKNTEVSAYYGFPAFTTGDIPDGSTINSVTVELEFKVSTTASIATQTIQIYLTTTPVGTEASNATEPTTDTVLSRQETSGISLTNLRTADLVRAKLRSVRGNDNDAVTFSIDYVKCTVDYTEVDNPPTVALNSPADAASISDTTPTLEFTGTDPDSIPDDVRYNVQISDSNSFDTTTESTADSYVEANGDANLNLNSSFDFGQSFTGDGGFLKKSKFYLKLFSGSDTCVLYSALYAHTGTFGTDSKGTGSPLAVSTTTITEASLNSSTHTLVTFDFSGYKLESGTKYVIMVRQSAISGTIQVRMDSSSPSHAGNRVQLITGSSWSASSTQDVIFYVITTPSSLLLNKISGTDSGFANTVTGGDTDPFNSGEKASYTVQAGDALVAGTWYWRVRATDPSGSNTYGAWATTRSFTLTIGDTDHVKNLSDTVTIAEIFVKKPVKILIDSMAMAEIFMNKPTLIRTDNITLSDVLIKTVRLNPADTMTLSDLFAKTLVYIRAITDNMVLADTIAKTSSKPIADTMTLADAISKATGLVKTDSMAIADAMVKTAALNKTDTMGITDTLAKVLSYLRSLSDTVDITDALLKTYVKNSSDTLVISDSLTKQLLTIVLLTDSQSLTDSAVKVVGKTLADTFSLADALAKTFSLPKTDTVALADVILKTLTKPITDNMVLSDVVFKTTGKNLAETFLLADALGKVMGLNKADNVLLADTVIKAAVRNQSDTLTMVDVLARATTISPNDAVAILDAIAKASGKNLTDTASIADLISKRTGINKTDTVTVTDSPLKTIGKGLSDTVAMVDSLTRRVVKAISDTLGITDLISVVSSFIPPATRIYEMITDKFKWKRGMFSSKTSVMKKKDEFDSADDQFKKKLF